MMDCRPRWGDNESSKTKPELRSGVPKLQLGNEGTNQSDCLIPCIPIQRATEAHGGFAYNSFRHQNPGHESLKKD